MMHLVLHTVNMFQNVGIYSSRNSCRLPNGKEIKFIGGVVNDPHKPVVAILGGAKVSDKIGVIKI